jgi:hypothetical protein
MWICWCTPNKDRGITDEPFKLFEAILQAPVQIQSAGTCAASKRPSEAQ